MNDNKVALESFVFPTRHLPKCFSNLNLYDSLKEIYDNYDDELAMLKDNFEIKDGKITEFKGYTDNIYGLKKGTEPLNVNISKPNGANRIISIANPLVLVPLHYYICQNNKAILEEQFESTNNYDSSSRFFFVENDFIKYYDYDGEPVMSEYSSVIQPNYQKNLLNKQKICDGKYYHMTIDINNFFNNIYTHSISWNLSNTSNKIIFDNLDFLTRTLNGNETKGIIIGPYTSSLFAEIILSKVDKIIVPKCKKQNISYIRFCDDYDFYSDSKEQLENDIKKSISENLSKYKLDLNMNKFKLEEFPFISLSTVQNKNFFLILRRIQDKDYGDNKLEFIEDIMNEINNSVKIKYSNCNYLLKILLSNIKKGIITKESFDDDTAEILLDFLINMMFKQNMISTDAFNLIVAIFKMMNLDNERIINKWIAKRNSRISHIKEITDIWLAYIIITLNICNDNTNSYMIQLLDNSDLGSILAIEYFYENNILVTFKNNIKNYLLNIKTELVNRYNNDWKKAGYYSKYWLLFYTNCIRWKIHEIAGFKETLFSDFNLFELTKDSVLKEKLNIFLIMYNIGINFIVFKKNNENTDD